MTKIWLAFVNLIYPLRCVSCKKDLPFDRGRYICRDCWVEIVPVKEPFCRRCGVHLPHGGMHCFLCRKSARHFNFVRCHGVFEGSLRNAILQLKYGGKDYVSRDLGPLLAQAWERHVELRESEIVIPVPLHPSNLRERGYNQSRLLADEFVRRMGQRAPLKVLDQVLLRRRKTVSQTRLKREDRMKNMDSAFQVNGKFQDALKGRNILVIDDVSTTGATIDECARELRKHGAKSVCGLTLARD